LKLLKLKVGRNKPEENNIGKTLIIVEGKYEFMGIHSNFFL
jgi:hypothetical protein